MEAADGAPPHIAMFTTTGKGHLFPLVEFARKLLIVHNFSITIFIPNDGSPAQPQKNLLKTLPSIRSKFLPPISLKDIPSDAPIEIPIVLSVTRSIPALYDALVDLNRTARISAFVTDLFGTFALESVKKLEIPFYIFYPGSAMTLSFVFHFPELDRSWNREYRDLPEPVKLPGCVPLSGSDFVSPAQDRNGPGYELVMEICRMFPLVDGIVADSFLDLEPEAFKALGEGNRSGFKPPIYPVGPLVRSGLGVESEKMEKNCLKWLDKQSNRSVLYVAFGSGGTLSSIQLQELVLGLEMSGQRFLMVARPPDDKVRTTTYFTDGDDEMDPSEYLPAGFMERIEGKGFVVSHWAPQIDVLRHPAVGGFLTHCGWNSTLESIVHGVPLIAWPLFAEQRMNAVLLSEGLKVAMRVAEGENGVVARTEISRMVRSLIVGEDGAQLRKRMRNLVEVAARAWTDNGLSTKTLRSLIEKWK